MRFYFIIQTRRILQPSKIPQSNSYDYQALSDNNFELVFSII